MKDVKNIEYMWYTITAMESTFKSDFLLELKHCLCSKVNKSKFNQFAEVIKPQIT